MDAILTLDFIIFCFLCTSVVIRFHSGQSYRSGNHLRPPLVHLLDRSEPVPPPHGPTSTTTPDTDTVDPDYHHHQTPLHPPSEDRDTEDERSLFEKISCDFLEGGGSLPTKDFPSALRPPNPFSVGLDEARGRANPYDEEELEGVLRINDLLKVELKNEGGDGGPAASIVGYDGDDLYTTDAESEEV